MASPNPILTDLAAVLGPGGLVTDADILKRYKPDWLVETADPQAPLAVARPETTRQVPEVIKSCGQLAVSVVPQGGRTGLAGGDVLSAGCIILSLEKCHAPKQSTPLQRQ
jgi:FAD/FMN-containing dehydrogenase